LDPRAKTKDSDYVFITFILTQMPPGSVGLLVAVMFAAALSSKASELAALGTTTTIDFWRHLRPLAAADEARNVRVARRFTALRGVVAVAFALFAGFAENLIEAINILGSIFYGVLLGLFLVAFFLRRVGGSAVFFAAVTASSSAWPNRRSCRLVAEPTRATPVERAGDRGAPRVPRGVPSAGRCGGP